jgi:hypothetical protein
LFLYLFPQIFSIFLFSLHFLKEFFPPPQLGSEILLFLYVFFLSSLEVFNQNLTFLVHGLYPFFLFRHRSDVLGIQESVLFFLEKLVGSAYLDEHLGSLLFFVSVWMVLQGQISVALLYCGKIVHRVAVQQLVRVLVQLQFLQSFLQSLHLSYK